MISSSFLYEKITWNTADPALAKSQRRLRRLLRQGQVQDVRAAAARRQRQVQGRRRRLPRLTARRSRHLRTQGVAFWLFSHRWNQRRSMHAGRRVALRHDNLVAVGGRRRDERRRQVATARARSNPGFDVDRTGRGFDGSRSRCTTCREQHRRRCGGYQKIQLPHITNIAASNSSASDFAESRRMTRAGNARADGHGLQPRQCERRSPERARPSDCSRASSASRLLRSDAERHARELHAAAVVVDDGPDLQRARVFGRAELAAVLFVPAAVWRR